MEWIVHYTTPGPKGRTLEGTMQVFIPLANDLVVGKKLEQAMRKWAPGATPKSFVLANPQVYGFKQKVLK